MTTRMMTGVLLCALTFGWPGSFGSRIHASTILDSNDSLEVVTSTTAGIDYTVSYVDHTSSALTPGKSAGAISTATTTTILAAPAASTFRQIKEVTLKNTSTTTSNAITIQRDVSATNRVMATFTLAAGEWWDIDANGTMVLYSQNGLPRSEVVNDKTGIAGQTYAFYKGGTGKDAIGYHYWYGKDAGAPGGFVLQSPGVNGFSTDCSIATQTTDPNGATQMGAHILTDPASGSLYLTNIGLGAGAAANLQLIDVLWYNTGLVVTTTTGQNITMPALPARDMNGSTNGEGYVAALYALTALGNAAAVSNTTITYTNQDGTAGRTGTFSAVVGWQAPATPVIGTWMPFQLAAGDRGIRSIQTITLGTTYTSGTMALVLYRPLATVFVPFTNGVGVLDFAAPGVRLYNNTCISLLEVGASGTTNANIVGTYTITER